MAVTLSSPTHSFINFNEAPAVDSCCQGDEQFCIPVILPTDIIFQVIATCETAEEAQELMDADDGGIQLWLLNGTDSTPGTAAGNIAHDYTGTDGLFFERNRTGSNEVVFLWRAGLPDIDDHMECDECFQLAINLGDIETGVIVVSNCMKRKCSTCFTSVLEYKSDEDGFGFRYCNVANSVNRVRLPFFFHQAQFPDEETVYVRSDGSIKMLKSVSKKEYEVETEHFPELIHERFKAALAHDIKQLIEGNKYTGYFSKSGAYEIGWDGIICTAPAKFKALASPFLMRNNNCAACTVICADIDSLDVEVQEDDPGVTWKVLINSINWDVNPQPGINQTVAISYRPVGGGLFIAAGDIVFDENGDIVGVPNPFEIAGLDIAYEGIEIKAINSCNGESYIQTVNNTAGCVAVGLEGDPVLPDGVIGSPYNYSIPITGTGPFVLTIDDKPTWMTIAVVGSDLVFSGTPDFGVDDYTVQFNLENCEGTHDLAFMQTIDVLPAELGDIEMDCDNQPSTQDAIPFGTPGTYSFYGMTIGTLTPGQVVVTAHNDQAGSLSGYSMYKQQTITIAPGQTTLDFEVEYDGGGINTVFEMTFKVSDTSGEQECSGQMFSFI